MDVLLLDIVPRELDAKESAKGLTLEHPAVRNRIVNTALTTALKPKPSPVYVKNAAKKITTGNFDDDFEKISECDWILEAVVERLDIKKIIFRELRCCMPPDRQLQVTPVHAKAIIAHADQ